MGIVFNLPPRFNLDSRFDLGKGSPPSLAVQACWRMGIPAGNLSSAPHQLHRGGDLDPGEMTTRGQSL